VRPILTHAAETWTTTENNRRRKSFAEYVVQYAREGSGGRDAIEN
jgi:hypothetical protein